MNIGIEIEAATVDADRVGSGDVLLDATVYPIAAITRACYALANIATFEIFSTGNAFTVRIFPAQGSLIETVTERFRESLIDFALRENIEARTKGMRDLIWQTAFGEVQKRSRP